VCADLVMTRGLAIADRLTKTAACDALFHTTAGTGFVDLLIDGHIPIGNNLVWEQGRDEHRRPRLL
jgi:hypothetical protein